MTTTRYRPSADVVCTDLDSELILLVPSTGEAFHLNETARAVWLGLPAGVDALAESLTQAFFVEPAEARADVQALLNGFAASALAEPDAVAAE